MIRMASVLCMLSSLLSLVLWFTGEASSEPQLHGIPLLVHVIDAEISIPLSGIVGSAAAREVPRLAAVVILISAVAGKLVLADVYSVTGALAVIGAVTILAMVNLGVGRR